MQKSLILVASIFCCLPIHAKNTNIILIILDDFGAISFEPYKDLWGNASSSYARTPNFSRICRQGVRFTKAWATPTCSPTRATLLTGKYGFRTGVGTPSIAAYNSIRSSETTIPKLLNSLAPHYTHASVGKWHLSTIDSHELQGYGAPNVMGWQHYAGLLTYEFNDPTFNTYWSWDRTVDGVVNRTQSYATTQYTDDAISFLQSRRRSSPFFLWVAHSAPHRGFHVPPSHLHHHEFLSDSSSNLDKFNAMVEAADTETRRLFRTLPDEDKDGIPDNTLVIFIGDNGTLAGDGAMNEPYESRGIRGKGTLDEHGILVPLCIAGHGVVKGGRSSPHLTQTTDILATVFDMLEIDLDPIYTRHDSFSFAHVLRDEEPSRAFRTISFSEQFDRHQTYNNMGFTVRDQRLKYLKVETDQKRSFKEGCFDLVLDPLERHDLFNAVSHRRRCSQLKRKAHEIACSEPTSYWRQRWCES